MSYPNRPRSGAASAFERTRATPLPLVARIRSAIAWLISAGAVGVACAFVLASSVSGLHRLELLSHFARQYLVAAVLAALACLALGRARAALVSVLATAVLAWPVVQWTIPAASATSVTEGTPVRLVFANVLASQTDTRTFTDFVVASNPDIVAINELSAHWDNALRTAVRDRLPHSVSRTRSDAFGIGLLSRFPIESSDVIDLDEPGVPAIRAELNVGGSPLELIVMHPVPPVSTGYFEARNRQMADASARFGPASMPRVVAADLNASMWSPYYRDFAGSLSVVNARAGQGILATWPTYQHSLMRIPIDHVLVSGDIGVTELRLGPEIGSDHLPLLADIRIRRRTAVRELGHAAQYGTSAFTPGPACRLRSVGRIC